MSNDSIVIVAAKRTPMGGFTFTCQTRKSDAKVDMAVAMHVKSSEALRLSKLLGSFCAYRLNAPLLSESNSMNSSNR